MCALCGVLGVEHWTDMASFQGMEQRPHARRQERFHRVHLINAVLRHYGLRLDDWQGASFVLQSRTGRSELVPDLMAVWQVAAQMLGRQPDPLDPGLIEALEEHPTEG